MLRYMETSVRDSDRVILVCTPIFANKANKGIGGVGYEKAVVSAELFYSTNDTGKFIPILRAGDPIAALPSYIQSRIFIDFREDKQFDARLAELIDAVKGIRAHTRPPSKVLSNATAEESTTSTPYSLKEFESVFRFAYGVNGINLTNLEAARWTETFLHGHSYQNFEFFKTVFKFAFSISGLNLSNKEAASFGLTWLTKYPNRSIEEFKERFDFAFGISGMNLDRKEALEWALRQMDK